MADTTYITDICKGRDADCPNALEPEPGFAARLARAVEESGWPEFLAGRVKGPIRHHHRFRVALSGCANGCSRPHVADVGLIRAARPELDPALCTGCGLCVEACPDNAIRMEAGLAVVDETACLLCGTCARACPEAAMGLGGHGFRVLLGGKLGRRPRLATELPGLHSADQALDVVRACLAHYMAHHRPGLRLADLVARQHDPSRPDFL